MSTQPLLQATNLSFAYRDRTVLRDVSLSLSAGEVVALLGPNGSGKSTLIRTLIGHLPPRGGTIAWDGKPIESWRRRDLAKRVGYLPQSPAHEPLHTVADVLRLGRAPYLGPFGIESTRDEQVVRDIADRLALTEILDRPMDGISGGQRQRVFLGRALVQEPRALLLDEPNTFLDLRHQVELGKLLRALARERSLCVLLASHDLNLAASMADRLLLLHDGLLAADGPPDQVLQPELLTKVYGVEMVRIDVPHGAPVVLPRVR
jgi:iron complex transport system ATP-binding protein